MRWQDYIEQRPDVMVGKPVFKGTRLTVQTILEGLAAGTSEADLMACYPRLRPEYIRAALAYAAALVANDETLYVTEKSPT